MKRWPALLLFALALLPVRAGAQAGGQPCDLAATAALATSTLTTVITGPAAGNAKIRICGFMATAVGASVITWSYGTGANCGTTNVAFGSALQLASTTTVIDSSPAFRGFVVPPAGITLTGQSLCASASATASITVYYSLGN
jgi:hypothetical protein